LSPALSAKMSEEEREAEAEADYETCRSLGSSAAREPCWASANNRRGARATRKPLPPLVTWRVPAPDPTPRASGPARWVAGGVIVGGAFVACAVLEPCGAAVGGLGQPPDFFAPQE